MDTLSVELHAQIFEYACLDDGSTARALALVSHYIHDVAQPFLYQSLAVQGFIQMHALIATLTPLPHYLRRIRYLYLSDSSPSAWHHAPFESPGRILSDADMARYEEAQAAAAHLLLLAAPTLEMLAVTADCLFMGTALIAHLFALQLPHLRELAVRGFYPFLAGTDGPSMPRLERLHLEGNRSPYGLLDCGGMKETCPALEHLAISGVVAAHGFANEVEAVVCRSEGDME
ncbi:uncharacterized protein B0H18DRAFT_850559, partial [Fomitopsis serialis]|uniref:uncharacterized protein n=1 Tax=Fomitopsis serialis TaxID=139415 RepID=UPI002007C274